MEQNSNYKSFKSVQLGKIHAVNIKPSEYVFDFGLSELGDSKCILLSVISNEQPNKFTKKVFEKITLSYRYIISIDLKDMCINDVSMMMIKNCAFRFITAIDLSNNHLTVVGAKYIYECVWKYLKKINLADNPIKNKGLSYLCKSSWPLLDFVNLKCTKINDDGARCLTKV